MIMKYIYLLIIICLFTSGLRAKNKAFVIQKDLKGIQIKTIEIHNNIIKTQKSISNLNIEIKKNKQNQLILNKYLNNEENLAENLILLLNKKMIKSPEHIFLKNFIEDENNFLGDKIIMTFMLEAIKNDINIFLERINKTESFNLELNKKIITLNAEIAKLENSKIFLERELKKKSKLQKKNPKSIIFVEKQKKVKKKVKNINELVTGVSTTKKKKINIKTKKIIFPTTGNIISNFKQINNNSNYVNGLTFESNEDPYIVSPINGMIVFAGKFRSYGNLIIIENKNEYHSILSGMDEIITYSGNEVFVGEPIAKNYFKKGIKKKLYFELRYKGKPVDPKREVEIL